MTKSVRCLGVTGLVVGLLMAGALSVAAQGLQPRRTLGSRLARPAQAASCNADSAEEREARSARAAQRSQFTAGSLTAEFERERDTLFMDIVREAEICQTNLAEYATYPYWPDAMGVVSNFCEKENCVVVDVGHHFGSWRQSSRWQGSGKNAYVVSCNMKSETRFVPLERRGGETDGFCVISRGGSYTNVACRYVGSICCYDSDGRFVELYDSLDKIPGMKQCFDDELKVNYGKQDQWMKAHGFGEEGSGREAENRLDAARTNVIGRLNSLRTILSTFPQWQSDNKWHRVCDVGAGMGGPSAYGELSRSRPLLGGLRRLGSKPSINIDTNDEVLVRVNERFECLGRKQDKLIETVVRDLTGLEFGVSANTNGMLDLKFSLGSYETCTFDTNQGDVNSVTLIAEFEPSCEQKTIHEKLDMSLSTLLSAIGMDRNALAYEVSLNGARPLVGLRRPAGNQDWKSVQSFSQRFTISRNKQQSGQYVVTISDQKKAVAPTATDNARRSGLLGGGTLRARRLQRQQEAEAAAAKQREEQAVKGAERQAQAEQEKTQREAERAEQRRQLQLIQEELNRVREAKAAAAKGECATSCITNKLTSEKGIVAEKLGQCDFLLNKDFKKNAKVYLCLFSASWCPPCRAEMPRIAKTYTETLKDDPDIELIHFSRDQNDEKAMAWAKEHDVKFPVVKPKGGNPLDLHSRGIPHLFIVKADGTLVEEGHPMRIFNEEKFRELKGGGATDGAKPQEDKACSSATEGVTNVTTEGGLFTLTGPYGIRMTADPGCEKGAEYVMKRLVEHYLPRAKEFYGDPFLGEKPSRTYRIDVRRNDGLGNSTYTGPSYGPGTGRWSIGLSKGADRFEMSLDYLASSVLTLCEEPKWASFVFYVNRFVEAKAKGIDAAPRLKEDIRRGLEEDDEEGKNNWYRSHAPLWAALEDLRAKHPKLMLDYCALKNKRFAEGKLPKKLSLDQMAALLSEVSGENASELFNKYGVKDSNAKKAGNGGNSPARAKTRGGKDYSKGEKGTAAVDGITWSYSIQDGEATIVSPTGKLYERAVAPQPVGDISIPSAVNGTPVTGIGKFALCNCPELVSVKIPNTVKHIDEWAFSGCANLIEVTIPSSVTEIGECVFASCPQLARIGVEADNPNYKVIGGVLYTKDMKCLVTGHGGLTSVTILAGVTDIGVGAFRCCRKLKSVTIPSSVKRIGKDAFCATALESIVIPSGVESIGNATFWCCGGMKSVVLSEGVKSIGFRAFLQCRGLESLTIPASVKRIEEFAFEGCSGLKSVTMCGERPEAKEKVFDKCDNLAAIHVPPNAKSWTGMKEWQGIPLVFDAE